MVHTAPPDVADPDALFAQALALHQQGEAQGAAARYRAILALDPAHADSLHLLGLLTVDHGDPMAAIGLIRRAIDARPGFAPHYNSLGHAYRRLGHAQDAIAAYRQAARLRPESAEIHNNLATALVETGGMSEAIGEYRLAASLAPDNADVWYNLANTLAQAGADSQVEACFTRALALRPDHAGALGNYGRWLIARARRLEAAAVLEAAVRAAPAEAGCWNNLGIVRRELGRPDAEPCFRRALALAPEMADAHYNLGCLLFADGQTDAAITCHQAALDADPRHGRARLALCMARLPILYASEAEVAERRARYHWALTQLEAGGDDAALAAAIGTSQPFFLPYQGEDDRGLQARFGRLACRLLAMDAPVAPPRRAARDRIRLGIVSGFFRDHTLFKLFLQGWLSHLDRTRFEIIGFHTDMAADATTDWCAAHCDTFLRGPLSFDGWRDAVRATAPDALLYPEVGIDPVAGRLAAQRLAPLQCVTWGHPETTGMPTIDAFLSSTLMEPDDSDGFYTENLVRLPNLGLCYKPDDAPITPLDRAALGLHADATVFWSGQALYKYLPQYDWVFPRIAAAVRRCQFVFIGFANSAQVTQMFHQRLGAAFVAAGLDPAAHVLILPPMGQADYLASAAAADVLLDTPGWSGGKSTLDCLAVDPAIVTMPGRFMRGRHTAAILRRIGCVETIAQSLEDYVAIAARLARDPVWRADVRARVARGRRLAYDDLDYVRALERFLAGALHGLNPAP